MAVVKANAYGRCLGDRLYHDDAGAWMDGPAEAVRLRRGNITAPILVWVR